MQKPFLKQKGAVMSDVTLFNKFKEIIEETYGDDFFELDFLKTNSEQKEILIAGQNNIVLNLEMVKVKFLVSKMMKL